MMIAIADYYCIMILIHEATAMKKMGEANEEKHAETAAVAVGNEDVFRL
jgi:hypothetical protein